MDNPKYNEGIIIQGGTINAGNLAIGKGARAVSREQEVPSSSGIRFAEPSDAAATKVAAIDAGDAEWDAFISHASEDKLKFVAALANQLRDRGLRIWYDDFVLGVGKSLRESIDFGLARSRYGVVVFSPYYFSKNWTHQEVNGLISRETGGLRIVLPVWHGVTREQVRRFSPILADRLAADSSQGVEVVVEKLVWAIRGS
jgi:hypothetical protein